MSNEEKRKLRSQRIAREIRSLRISGGGHEYSEARRLRADKIEAVADRLSYALDHEYSLLDLARHIGTLTSQHRELRNTPDEMRTLERAANSPTGEPGDEKFARMTAEERLVWANANAVSGRNNGAP